MAPSKMPPSCGRFTSTRTSCNHRLKGGLDYLGQELVEGCLIWACSTNRLWLPSSFIVNHSPLMHCSSASSAFPRLKCGTRCRLREFGPASQPQTCYAFRFRAPLKRWCLQSGLCAPPQKVLQVLHYELPWREYNALRIFSLRKPQCRTENLNLWTA